MSMVFNFLSGVFIACRCSSLIVVIACMLFCYDYLQTVKQLTRKDEIALLVAGGFSGWMMFERIAPSFVGLSGTPLLGFIVGAIPCAYCACRLCYKLHEAINKLHGR